MNRNALRPLAFVLGGVMIAATLNVSAGFITVTTEADSGPGSLRWAIGEAFMGDTILVHGDVEEIVLESELFLQKDVTIRGLEGTDPDDCLVISGNHACRIFRISQQAHVYLQYLVIENGYVSGEDGGGIHNEGTLIISYCTVKDCEAVGGSGGGIYNAGTLQMDHCSVVGNSTEAAPGVEMTGNGGGICNRPTHARLPWVKMINSTLSGNAAVSTMAMGAGDHPIEAADALAMGNGLGGGLFNGTRGVDTPYGPVDLPGLVEAHNCTVAFNTAVLGGGFCNHFGEGPDESGEELEEPTGGGFLLSSCILSDNTSEGGAAHDLLGDAAASHSLIQDGVGNFSGEGLVRGASAGLDALSHNGGVTLTHALLPGSPAINGGSNTQLLATDQSGSPRILSGRADAGALEHDAVFHVLGGGGTVVYRDSDGDNVEVTLTGPGAGIVTVPAGSDAVDIILEGTTDQSNLMLKARQKGRTTIRDILVTGSLRYLWGIRVDLLGAVEVEGSLFSLSLNDVHGPARIGIGEAGPMGTSIDLGHVRDLRLETPGRLEVVTAKSWDGTGDGFMDRVKADSIGFFMVQDRVSRLRIESAEDIGKVKAGAMDDTYLLAGALPGHIGLVDPESGFVGEATLGKLKITGNAKDAGQVWFSRSVVCAHTIERANLGKVNATQEKPYFGLSADRIGKLTYKLDGKVHTLKNLDEFSDSVRSGGFTVSLDSTSDLGWNFAVLDDTRGDLWLPGVATANLKILLRKAADDHCAFVLAPGDLGAGNMVTCMTEELCELLDPGGHASQLYSDTQMQAFIGAAADCGYILESDGTSSPILYAVRGNHEGYLWKDTGRTQFTKYFGRHYPQNGPAKGSGADQNPEIDERGLSYTFTYRNAFFLGIDEYAAVNDKDGGLFPMSNTVVPSCFSPGWVAEQVQTYRDDPGLQHCFLFGHSPLYKIKMDTSLDANAATQAGRDAFLAAVNGAAEIYFCGHEHFYDHAILDGTEVEGGTGIEALHHVLSGTGGAEIDRTTEEGCDYSPMYIRDPQKQFYHNPEVPQSGDKPEPFIGYNLVTVTGKDVDFSYKAWPVDNPCYFSIAPVPCTLCPWCTVDQDAGIVRNEWHYSVDK